MEGARGYAFRGPYRHLRGRPKRNGHRAPSGHNQLLNSRHQRVAVDRPTVATNEEKPWWELEGKPPPHHAQFEAERERLRDERARTWRERLDKRERRRLKTSVPPPRPRAA